MRRVGFFTAEFYRHLTGVTALQPMASGIAASLVLTSEQAMMPLGSGWQYSPRSELAQS